MVEERENCERMYSYLSSGLVDDTFVKTFTDCSKYKNICHNYGRENVLGDIFLAISTDGFRPHKKQLRIVVNNSISSQLFI